MTNRTVSQEFHNKESCFVILQPHGTWWATETELRHKQDKRGHMRKWEQGQGLNQGN